MDPQSGMLLQLLAGSINQEAMLTAIYQLQIAAYAKNNNQNFDEVKKTYDETVLRLQGEITAKFANLMAQLDPKNSMYKDFVDKATKGDPSKEEDNQ